MIYTYSKMLDATGSLHPMATEEEKETHKQIKASPIGKKAHKYSWVKLKPHMLKLYWFKDCSITTEHAVRELPYGVKSNDYENWQYWSVQATKWFLLHLHKLNEHGANSDKSTMAKKEFRAAMQARRQQYGLVSHHTTPDYFNTRVNAMVIMAKNLYSNLTLAHGTRSVINDIHGFIDSLKQAYPLPNATSIKTDEVMKALRFDLVHQSVEFTFDKGQLQYSVNSKAIDEFIGRIRHVDIPSSLPAPIPCAWKVIQGEKEICNKCFPNGLSE